jgi:hypothetical protein
MSAFRQCPKPAQSFIKAVPESRNQLLQSKDVFKGAHNGFLDA